ncbi:helitron_like_N domain-containing protein [Trichonephila clavata]|uniref:Helitron_like_N domain-containing protein n=1 Tax=Trichonephila clavata TaxID=2740835 RepID=A0A8X6K0M5_TRICU|nr:helitron_like_N domain-containing protein [Trichonephila clavata]
MAVIGIGAENSNDEVTQYQMGRCVSSNEAVWRIFSFPIHERHPSVVHLAVHLENGQRVYFTAQNAVQRAAQPPSTTLTSFFETCQNDDFAQTLLYSEMPKYYTWNQSSRRFIRRKQGKPVPGYTDVYSTDAIGRIYSVHRSNDECFYLRLLLVNVRGPTHHSNSYELLMVNCVDPTEKPVNVCNCLKMTLIGIKLSMML